MAVTIMVDTLVAVTIMVDTLMAVTIMVDTLTVDTWLAAGRRLAATCSLTARIARVAAGARTTRLMAAATPMPPACRRRVGHQEAHGQ